MQAPGTADSSGEEARRALADWASQMCDLATGHIGTRICRILLRTCHSSFLRLCCDERSLAGWESARQAPDRPGAWRSVGQGPGHLARQRPSLPKLPTKQASLDPLTATARSHDSLRIVLVLNLHETSSTLFGSWAVGVVQMPERSRFTEES